MPYAFLLGGQSLMVLMHSRLTASLQAAYPGCKVLPCAVGGSLISRWQRGADCYDAALTAMLAAMREGYEPGAFLFYQGQSDALTAYSATAPYWGASVVQMGLDFRMDIVAPTLPIIYATLGENPTPPADRSQYGGWASIRLQGIELNAPRFTRVSSWGCGPYIDARPYCHLPAAGLDVLSDRFMNKTRAVVE